MPKLIDVDALMKAVEKDFEGVCVYDVPPSEAVSDFERIVDSMPTIDAEPVRHGRWILKAHDKRVNYLWTVTAYCSECCDEENEIWSGYFPGVPDFMAKDVALDSARTVKLSNYCPNCGAKMDLEVQDDTD